jgi:lipopolysaccharide/colanic/teichoic acid biosynthesis glycosyltransferase
LDRNLLKGDLKLVGVRPISQRYFNDIPKDLQDLRSKFKPGCVPPYVALNRNGDVQSVLIAEREYLKEKVNSPFTTDTKFFFKAIFNILVKGKRSA